MKALILLTTLLLSFEGKTNDPVCNIDNYMEYIYDEKKTDILIEKTRGGCFLGRANLSNLDLRASTFKKAYFRDAKLQGTNLEGANLKGTTFISANLDEANLSSTNLDWTTLLHASLKGADLTFANLTGANLIAANFEGANLTLANLKKTKLTCANLKKANLAGANLENAITHQAFYSNETIFPAGFDPKRAEMVLYEGTKKPWTPLCNDDIPEL